MEMHQTKEVYLGCRVERLIGNGAANDREERQPGEAKPLDISWRLQCGLSETMVVHVDSTS